MLKDIMSVQEFAGSLGGSHFQKRALLSVICTLLLAYLFVAWSRSSLIIAIDHGFFEIFTNVTRQSWALDMLIVQIFRTETAKNIPMLACVVWLLLEHSRKGQSNAFFGQLVVGSLLAMTASRVMQNFSAYRPRPLHNPDLVYELPYGIEATTLEGWSSFPSDTSALGFAIAAGIFVTSKRLGLAAFLWTAVVVAFPRAYAGLHYPSDLMGGALIGLLCTAGVAPLILHIIPEKIKHVIYEKWMPLLWTLGFLYMFQMATMFDNVRSYGSYLKDVLGL